MIIISHRGYWKSAAEKNTPAAFARSFQLGFGAETDLRDFAGRLVISHDPPGLDALPADALFEIHVAANGKLPLALDIKSDGLQPFVKEILEHFQPADHFVFDMSIPDALGYLAAGIPVFTRHSEFERQPAFYEKAAGVWMDGFETDWMREVDIHGHLKAGKRVCIVSPELHGRNHLEIWQRLAAMPCASDPRLMLCTDFPEEARDLFRGSA